MGFFGRGKRRFEGRSKKRVVGLGIDGVPYTLAKRFMEEGIMPHFASLLHEGSFLQMDSVYPTVSNVAWASFTVGKNPGKFNVFGFAEITPNKELYIPCSKHVKGESIWEILSKSGKRVIALGVPMTYPPRPVNGILVSDFLVPKLDSRAVYPPEALRFLQKTNYKVDIDPVRAREDLEFFKRELIEVFTARAETCLFFYEHEPWDLLFVHCMETDRINHFMWRFLEENDPVNGTFFLDFYRALDGLIGKIKERLDSNTTLVILSDHGFCRIKREVQLNSWLGWEGYLAFDGNEVERQFKAITPESRAFALVPGRIYLLREGVWEGGSVSLSEYAGLRTEITEKLRAFKDPASGDPICKKVLVREEAFSGPYVKNAPDIVVDPHDGYDFKAALGQAELFSHSPISGMHTYHDALIYISGYECKRMRPKIYDAAPTMLEILGVEPPFDFDGESIQGSSNYLG